MTRRFQRTHQRARFARQARRVNRIDIVAALLGLIAAAGATPESVVAQRPVPHVDRFTVDDGLAQNRVQAIAQDRAGFIWLGGDRGLQRFDGYAFTQYAEIDSAAPAELRGLIGDIRVDRRGTLWVQASGALFRRDEATQRLLRVPLAHGTSSFSAAWAPDSAGRLWIIDGDSLRWIEPGGTPVRPHAAVSVAAWAIGAVLATSRSGQVWLARGGPDGGRVARLDPATGHATVYPLLDIRTPAVLLEDSRGQVWVGGDSGVEVLAAGADRFRSVRAFRGVAIRTLVQQDSAVILVPTDGALSRVDGRGIVVERWDLPAVVGAGVLPTHVIVDREGGIWVATLANGVLRIDPRSPLFRYTSSHSSPPLSLGSDFVTALAELDDGTLWIGTLRGGAYRISADGRRVETFRHDPRLPGSLNSDEVLDFQADKGGSLWVATNRGLCRFVLRDFHCFAMPFGAAAVAVDPDGWFWLAGAPASVMSFDPTTGRFGPEVPTPAQSTSLLADGDSGYLWIGGGALLRARTSSGRILGPVNEVGASAAPAEPIYDLHRDSHGNLWLGSYRGLQHWDPERRRFTSLDVPELRNVTVFSIEDDARGNLWLGTSHGLVRYSPVTGLARRYRRQDGVLSGEFNRRAAIRLRNGELLFGGVEGLTRVRPDALPAARAAPPVVFTQWRRLTASGLVDVPIDTASRLRVGPGDRALTFEFATLTFAAGPARRYRFRLEGLRNDWIETADHAVTYPTPPPGRYTFRVQAAGGAEGEWSAPGSAVNLQVVPPFWGTAWFRALLLLGCLALAWAAHRLRLRQALATERLRVRISRDLHDEIGAGLSTIALLSDSAGSSEVLAEPERTHLERIGTSAREMVNDLRDIVWAIDPEGDQLDDVVIRMQDVATTLLQNVRVTFHAPGASELTTRIDMAARRDLLLLYKEVLHNVARHASATEVRIDVVARGSVLELTVADNGIGFDAGDSRTGIGSKSVRERVARLGGNLEVTSQPGRGTSVRLTWGAT